MVTGAGMEMRDGVRLSVCQRESRGRSLEFMMRLESRFKLSENREQKQHHHHHHRCHSFFQVETLESTSKSKPLSFCLF
ncbi:UNVERIFIED_CONTAM: hypothetical protein FKN15_044913 [Acipenser sinensis]